MSTSINEPIHIHTFYEAASGKAELLDTVITDDRDDIPLGPGQEPGRAGARSLIEGSARSSATCGSSSRRSSTLAATTGTEWSACAPGCTASIPPSCSASPRPAARPRSGRTTSTRSRTAGSSAPITSRTGSAGSSRSGRGHPAESGTGAAAESPHGPGRGRRLMLIAGQRYLRAALEENVRWNTHASKRDPPRPRSSDGRCSGPGQQREMIQMHQFTQLACDLLRQRLAHAAQQRPAQHLRSIEDVAGALMRLRAARPDVTQALVKLNEGVSGEGNAVVDLRDLPAAGSAGGAGRNHPPGTGDGVRAARHRVRLLRRQARGARRHRRGAHQRRRGAQPESAADHHPVRGSGAAVHPRPALGVPGGQSDLGCSFPADAAYATQISAEARSGDGSWTPYAIELNLRKGGTTHPFLTLQFLTNGRYDPATALFRTPRQPGEAPRCDRSTRIVHAPRANRRRPLRYRGAARPALRPRPAGGSRVSHDQLPDGTRAYRPHRGRGHPLPQPTPCITKLNGSCSKRPANRWLRRPCPHSPLSSGRQSFVGYSSTGIPDAQDS